MQTTLHTFLRLVEQELSRARRKHPPLHSLHEAYAVLLEELEEFKAQVWQQSAARVGGSWMGAPGMRCPRNTRLQ